MSTSDAWKRWLLDRLLRLLAILPARLMGGLGAGLGRLFYILDRRHRHIALDNLALIYPEASPAWRRRTARESFAELGRAAFEMPAVFYRNKQRLLAVIDVEGLEAVQAAMEAGKGVIVNACHHSNWELGALSFSLLGLTPCHLIYRPLNQSWLDAMLKQARERFGNICHSRKQGLRWIPRAIRRGDMLALMIDQHHSTGDPIPFWGHLARSTTLPVLFGRRHDTPQFGVALIRHGRRFRFTLRFWPIPLPPLHPDRQQDHRQCMAVIADSFRPIIDARPELWLWVHRRWLYLTETASTDATPPG